MRDRVEQLLRGESLTIAQLSDRILGSNRDSVLRALQDLERFGRVVFTGVWVRSPRGYPTKVWRARSPGEVPAPPKPRARTKAPSVWEGRRTELLCVCGAFLADRHPDRERHQEGINWKMYEAGACLPAYRPETLKPTEA